MSRPSPVRTVPQISFGAARNLSPLIRFARCRRGRSMPPQKSNPIRPNLTADPASSPIVQRGLSRHKIQRVGTRQEQKYRKPRSATASSSSTPRLPSPGDRASIFQEMTCFRTVTPRDTGLFGKRIAMGCESFEVQFMRLLGVPDGGFVHLAPRVTAGERRKIPDICVVMALDRYGICAACDSGV
jgi:hypothetical protein